MPIPLIYAVAMLTLGVVLVRGAKYVVNNWDQITRNWSGKCIAILGERGVGKTTMYRFLSNGTLPEKYELTEASGVKMQGRRFSLKDLNLVIKDGRDVPGSTVDLKYLSLWKRTVEESDIVIFMIRADKLAGEDTACFELAMSDARHIKKWCSKQQCFVVGTHFDLVPGYCSVTDAEEAKQFVERFRALESVKKILRALDLPPERVLAGSQKSSEETGVIVAQIFQSSDS